MIFASAFSCAACSAKRSFAEEGSACRSVERIISEEEVLAFMKAWGEGIVNIGKIYLQKKDYRQAALEHLKKFYDYEDGAVLFKPTMAAEKQFRTDLQSALSYFIAGDENYPEDHGFALKPWSSVRWENCGIKIIGNIALAMGNYYFKLLSEGDEVKVEYSFVFIKKDDCRLKILLHDSHLPYKPETKH